MAYYHKFPSLFRPQGGVPPFSPTDIPDLTLWLDASDTSTITQVAGSVSQWNDKSGNGFNAIQTNGANQPVTNSRILNGHNVIDFNGTTSFINHSTSFRSMISGAAQFTIIIIYASDTTSGTQSLFAMNNGGSTILDIRQTPTSFANGSAISVSNDSNTAPRMGVYRRSGVDRSIIRDGVMNSNTSAVDQTYNNAVTTGRTPQGASNYLDGVVAEISLYTRYLSDSELNAWGPYSNNKWGSSWVNL